MTDNSTEMNALMDYVDGTLEGPALAAFEERLAADSGLRAEADRLIGVRDAVRRYGLKGRVAAIRAEMVEPVAKTTQTARVRTLRSARWWMAVAVLLLLAAGLYQYESVTNDGMYKKMYEPYSIAANRGDEGHSGLAKAYKDKQYDQAIAVFAQEPAPSVEDCFYAGVAAMELGSYAKAAAAFEKLLQINGQTGSHEYQDAAEYYCALSLMETGRIEQALPLFEKIHNDEAHAYHDKVGGWTLRQLRWLRSRKR